MTHIVGRGGKIKEKDSKSTRKKGSFSDRRTLKRPGNLSTAKGKGAGSEENEGSRVRGGVAIASGFKKKKAWIGGKKTRGRSRSRRDGWSPLGRELEGLTFERRGATALARNETRGKKNSMTENYPQ